MSASIVVVSVFFGLGERVVDSHLRPKINWSLFFGTWKEALEHVQVRKLFIDAISSASSRQLKGQ